MISFVIRNNVLFSSLFLAQNSTQDNETKSLFYSLVVRLGSSTLLEVVVVVVVVVVFFTLTDRASTIPSNTRGSQSGTWSAGQKNIRGTSTKLQ